MTLEEWASLDEDVSGELVDGYLEEEEMPTWRHEMVVSWLVTRLTLWSEEHGGFVVASEGKIATGGNRGRKPDVQVFLPGRRRPSGRASLALTPPSVAVEVVSPTPRDGRRDRVEKRHEYAAAGIPWYWILDPELRTLEVYGLRPEGHYADALVAAEGRHPIPGCDGLELDLDAMWARLEAWETE